MEQVIASLSLGRQVAKSAWAAVGVAGVTYAIGWFARLNALASLHASGFGVTRETAVAAGVSSVVQLAPSALGFYACSRFGRWSLAGGLILALFFAAFQGIGVAAVLGQEGFLTNSSVQALATFLGRVLCADVLFFSFLGILCRMLLRRPKALAGMLLFVACMFVARVAYSGRSILPLLSPTMGGFSHQRVLMTLRNPSRTETDYLIATDGDWLLVSQIPSYVTFSGLSHRRALRPTYRLIPRDRIVEMQFDPTSPSPTYRAATP